MKGLAQKHPLIERISNKLGRIRRNGFSEIKESITNRRKIAKIGRRLEVWVKEKRHLEEYGSTDDLLNELGITNKELSFYCSRVFQKRFVTWRKELRINEAKELLLKHPKAPVCHIGFAVGFSDKSNFRHQFKKVVGCTPNEWRAMHLDEYPEAKD